MKLHYSQTILIPIYQVFVFDYHMKLHYSQTFLQCAKGDIVFDYHMKLHYSQTDKGLYKDIR